MSAKRAISLIMAKMAMVDGEIVVAEREFLRPLLDHGECLETFVQEASRVSLNEIVSNLTNYADKFYVALRASSMSHIDQSEHPTERALYMELLDLLELALARNVFSVVRHSRMKCPHDIGRDSWVWGEQETL